MNIVAAQIQVKTPPVVADLDDHPWEYHEETAPIGFAEPPYLIDSGWTLVERFNSGSLTVFRFRRPKSH